MSRMCVRLELSTQCRVLFSRRSLRRPATKNYNKNPRGVEGQIGLFGTATAVPCLCPRGGGDRRPFRVPGNHPSPAIVPNTPGKTRPSRLIPIIRRQEMFSSQHFARISWRGRRTHSGRRSSGRSLIQRSAILDMERAGPAGCGDDGRSQGSERSSRQRCGYQHCRF
jgi:hypothetical protein